MSGLQTRMLPETPDVTAPDGSDVRVLCALEGGSMAHFELAAGKVSQAVMHPRLEEIWYVISGHGQMWRALGDSEETEDLKAGLALTIPAQTRFQFRSTGPGPLQAVAITMPPWSSDDDAVAVEGAWEADL